MNEINDAFDRLLGLTFPPETVRGIETGSTDWRPVWDEIEQSGFLDLLVPEEAGGAGIAWADSGALFALLGCHAVPAPIAETMVARLFLAQAGVAAPAGPILIVTRAEARPAQLFAVPFGRVAASVLLVSGDGAALLSLDGAGITPALLPGSLAADIAFAANADGTTISVPGLTLDTAGQALAVLRAHAIAGAAARLLDMTLGYAADRNQFGKPIGRQQAVQQQLAVMAEKVVMARMAADMGSRGAFPPSLAAAATAKQVASTAGADICAIAHAVHGAIGISEEYDLQLFTRRIHEWRLEAGGATHWAQALGRARLQQSDMSTLDFVRSAEDTGTVSA